MLWLVDWGWNVKEEYYSAWESAKVNYWSTIYMMLNAPDATWVVLLPEGECVGYFRTGSGPSLFILCDANKKSCSSQGNNHSYQNIQIGCESFSRITTPLNLFEVHISSPWDSLSSREAQCRGGILVITIWSWVVRVRSSFQDWCTSFGAHIGDKLGPAATPFRFFIVHVQ